MLEKVLTGSRKFYMWIAALCGLICIGAAAYVTQLMYGMEVTGLTRDNSWGFYIAQFTYLVGVAASAVMLVLPTYFHHYKHFKRFLVFGEFLAIGAVVMCLLFIIVDVGQPQKALNMVFFPTPGSILFWDMVVLMGYLFLNIIIGWTSLEAERYDVEYPKWIKTLIYVSVFWAFGIHTVTAFLYAGLPGRHMWLTAILAARFLASAFCSGPAILLLSMLLLKKLVNFDIGTKATRLLSLIIAYAMALNVFFFCLELFTAYYSGIPGHQHPFDFLFVGHGGFAWINLWMWVAVVLALGSLFCMMYPKTRTNDTYLPYILIALVAATWIDKGLGLIIGGFAPTPFEHYPIYTPTLTELLISVGIVGVGLLIVSLLWKIVIEVKKEADTFDFKGD